MDTGSTVDGGKFEHSHLSMESIDYLAETHGVVLKGNEQCGWVHRRVTVLRKAVCMTSRRLLDNSIKRDNIRQFVAEFKRLPPEVLSD